MRSGEGKEMLGQEGTSESGAESRAAGAAEAKPEFRHELPGSYGTDRVVALVRDPYWIYVYWELTENTLSGGLQRLGAATKGARRGRGAERGPPPRSGPPH